MLRSPLRYPGHLNHNRGRESWTECVRCKKVHRREEVMSWGKGHEEDRNQEETEKTLGFRPG